MSEREVETAVLIPLHLTRIAAEPRWDGLAELQQRDLQTDRERWWGWGLAVGSKDNGSVRQTRTEAAACLSQTLACIWGF